MKNHCPSFAQHKCKVDLLGWLHEQWFAIMQNGWTVTLKAIWNPKSKMPAQERWTCYLMFNFKKIWLMICMIYEKITTWIVDS